MRSRGVLVAGALLVLAGCGDDSGEADEADGPPPDSCPSFAVVSEGAGDTAYQDYIVGFELSLMRDAEARADLLAGVADELCLAVTEERTLAIDSVIVDSGRPLDPDGQRKLVDALTTLEGVTYAEPDAVVSIDPPGTAE